MLETTAFVLNDALKVNECVDFSHFSEKSILITGSSGLLGQYFLATLANSKRVGVNLGDICLVTRNTLPQHLVDIAEYLSVRVLIGDITETKVLDSIPCDFDIIFHAAGYGQPQKFMQNELATLLLNTSSTANLLKKLKSNGHFLYMSSSEVYSGSQDVPYRETGIGTTNTNHPRACYIEAKRCGEAIVNSQRKLGVDAKSIRLALAYGPGLSVNDVRVLNEFIMKAVKGENINLLDSGASKRTYIYVTDALEMILNVMLFGKSDIYNVSGVSKTTIWDMAKIIADQCKVSASPGINQGGLIGAPTEVSLDINKILNEFPKKDFVSFEEGLSRVIEWYKIQLR